MERKDKFRHLPWQEYNATLASDARRKEIALRLFSEMVERGYSREAALTLIKSTYFIDLTIEVSL
jgi:hypothetical protein